ncbi:uncharacterized protein EDB91DRAFT_1117638 [Suillus paluster]|uniref:uncharacterized protein n=1 Tax=Suillus paluster TaxID=48578 RepID=UPI001B880318|nr:uncharacterized protein EDB91DRAFT_1117638 [Suillus paluster]KAG1746562.1 hypothetical protein EDB91DRAFT_1117638 [Suillus paluster]
MHCSVIRLAVIAALTTSISAASIPASDPDSEHCPFFCTKSSNCHECPINFGVAGRLFLRLVAVSCVSAFTSVQYV